MKKLLFALLVCIASLTSFAQSGAWDSNAQGCFCCNGLYNLPTKPLVEGPVTLDCAGGGKYCTDACPTATYSWSVSPTAPFTGQGTKCIILGGPLTPSAYTITVTISCGNKSVSNSKVVKVTGSQNCKPDFTITVTQLTSGSLNVNAVPAMLTPGQEHWWGIQYNGTYPNCTVPCSPIPFTSFNSSGVWGGYINATGILSPYMGTGITTGTTPYGIAYGGFSNNSCFKVTHYVKCCGVYLRQTQCFSIGTNNAKMAPGSTLKPDISISAVEIVNKKDLPKELQQTTIVEQN
jgi:hypothetical protein